MPPRARNERDARLAARLAELGTSYRGWAAFWVHDLGTGAWAGWNSDASFPAASTVKLGVLAEALRRGNAPGSPLWYDLRQLTGWSSNLAANRLTPSSAARRWSRLAQAPRRAREHVPRPVPRRNLGGRGRAETAGARPLARHDGARSRQDVVRAPGRSRRQPLRRATTGLSRTEAGRGIALLVHSTRGGLLEPFFSAPVAHKEGWISDLRASAAIVYGRTPRIVVVLAYRPEITEAEARALGRRVAALTVD